MGGLCGDSRDVWMVFLKRLLRVGGRVGYREVFLSISVGEFLYFLWICSGGFLRTWGVLWDMGNRRSLFSLKRKTNFLISSLASAWA